MSAFAANEWESDGRRILGRYVWRSYFFNGGGWESHEARYVAPGSVRCIGEELFYARTIKSRWWGLRGYDVTWHRPTEPAA